MNLLSVDFCETMAREVCALCGAGYGTSEPMCTREHGAWICQRCVRECFLRLAEEKDRDRKQATNG